MNKIDLIIDALESAYEDKAGWCDKVNEALYAARELKALAQPEQEPPKREWVGLTDDEKESVYKHADAENHQLSKVVSAVEWLLKNKNTTNQ